MIRIRSVNGSDHAGIIDHATTPAPTTIDMSRARGQRDWVLLPAKQISRADVAPIYAAMHRRGWVVLEEDVVATVNPA